MEGGGGRMLLKREGGSTLPYAEAVQTLPKSKSELAVQFKNGRLIVFHDYFKAGHGPTNYPKWFSKEGDEPYEVKYRYDYEPYVVVGKGVHGLLPRFNGKLKGFGFNKSSWCLELHDAGYVYTVLPDAFLVHIWHPGKEGYRTFDKQVKGYYEKMLTDLANKYEREE